MILTLALVGGAAVSGGFAWWYWRGRSKKEAVTLNIISGPPEEQEDTNGSDSH